jgi:hypothetical protein
LPSAAITMTGPVVLFARWSRDLCTLTYSKNQATLGSVPLPQKALCGSTVTVAANRGNLARAKYRFAGWSDPYGAGTVYAAGTGTLVLKASRTLYARWVQR